MHSRRYKRKKKGFLAWLPVMLAGALVVVAFVMAPRLQPPPPRGPREAAPVAGRDARSAAAAARARESAPAPFSPVDESPDRREPAREPASPPVASAAERPAQPAAARYQRRHRARPAPAEPPPQDEPEDDLDVRWTQ